MRQRDESISAHGVPFLYLSKKTRENEKEISKRKVKDGKKVSVTTTLVEARKE